MGRFYDRYLKDTAHPERYREQAVNYLASLCLGREFGEDPKDFYARRPDIAKQDEEASRDRDLLDGVIAERQRQQNTILERSLAQAEQLSRTSKTTKSQVRSQGSAKPAKKSKKRSVCKI